jgi:hypothetical protein
VGSQVALEVIRYLTGYEAPVAAGASVTVDVAGGLRLERREWPPVPSCVLCIGAGRPEPALAAS